MIRNDHASTTYQLRPFTVQTEILSSISGNCDHADARIVCQIPQCFGKENVTLWIVIMRLIRRRTQSYNDLILLDTEILKDSCIWMEAWYVHVFLYSWIFDHRLYSLAHKRARDHVGHKYPVGANKSSLRAVFVVMHHDRRDTQQFTNQNLRPGSMRQSKTRTGLCRDWQKLRCTQTVRHDLQCFVSAVMSSNNFARNVEEVQKLTGLIHVTSGEHYLSTLTL